MFLLFGWRSRIRSMLYAVVSMVSFTVGLPGHLCAQGADPAKEITAEDLSRHLAVMASDSMQGRSTPSPALERVARYVAEQFLALGLKPYLTPFSSPSLIRRYGIPLRFDFAKSHLTFTTGAQTATVNFTAAASLLRPYVPKHPKHPNVVVITGRYTLQSDAVPRLKEQVQGKTALYIVPAGLDSAARNLSIDIVLSNAKSEAMVVLSVEDSTAFGKAVDVARERPNVDRPSPWDYFPQWSASVLPEAVPGLVPLLAAAGVSLTQARADTTPGMRELPSLGVSFDPQLHGTLTDSTTAPNVMGILEGRDSVLKREHIIIVAHMDQSDVQDGDKANHISNGADNASGTAALVALAKAFSHPDARPRRSLVFLATSGGANEGFWGSDIVASAANMRDLEGHVAFAVMAALNLDGIGRADKDSVRIGGLDAVQLEVPSDWIQTAHPDLSLTVLNGGTIFSPRSDHFAFARQGIPSLYFYNGIDKPSRLAGSLLPVDTEQAVRILRFTFYVAHNMANAGRPPRWTPEGRRQLLQWKSR